MVMGCGKAMTVNLILENGSTLKLMGMVYTHGSEVKVIVTRVSGVKVLNTDKVPTSLVMATSTVARMLMGSPMDKDSSVGRMGQLI